MSRCPSYISLVIPPPPRAATCLGVGGGGGGGWWVWGVGGVGGVVGVVAMVFGEIEGSCYLQSNRYPLSRRKCPTRASRYLPMWGNLYLVALLLPRMGYVLPVDNGGSGVFTTSWMRLPVWFYVT